MLRVELEILIFLFFFSQPHAGNGGLFTTLLIKNLTLSDSCGSIYDYSVIAGKTTFQMCATHFQSQKSQFILLFYMARPPKMLLL